MGEANESTIMVEGQEARALLDSSSQLLAIGMGKEIEFKTTTTAINFTN